MTKEEIKAQVDRRKDQILQNKTRISELKESMKRLEPKHREGTKNNIKNYTDKNVQLKKEIEYYKSQAKK
ncbi:MAG: hypothetical protein FJ340_06555 [Sphingomonadales bacterium]|nr:hypothetical protein [Sphingomonadales bacterium]